MKESEFVDRNKEKWKSFESLLDSKRLNPEDLREQFTQITDDLSYSRTYYKNRSVRVYLNSLGQKIYRQVYKNKRNQLDAFKTFLSKEIPAICYESRWAFLLAFITLILGMLAGWLITYFNPEFPASFFGQAYVNETIHNIKSGDPMGIYKDPNAFDMFLMIAYNNMKVAFLVFAAGILFSVGSMFITFYNGLMLGVFIFFFYQYNVIKEFHLTVWMHGTVEMLGLVLECGAGILLGKGLLFPGTYSRSKAFFISARKATLLMLVAMPLILFAAFIESYLTRYTEIPDLFRIMFILASLTLMIGYFVVYPYILFHNKKSITEQGEDELEDEAPLTLNFKNILKNGEVFLQSVKFLIEKFKPIMVYFSLMAILLTALIFFYAREDVFNKILFFHSGTGAETIANLFSSIRNIPLLLNLNGSLTQALAVLIMVVYTTLIIAVKINPYFEGFGFQNSKALWLNLITCTPLLSAWAYLPFTGIAALKWVYFLSIPIVFLYMSARIFQKQRIKNTLAVTLTKIAKTYLNFIIFTFVLLLMLVLIFSPIALFGISFISWIINVSQEMYFKIITCLFTGLMILCLLLGFAYLAVSSIFISFSNTEILTAGFLKSKIESIKINKKILGLESEE
jgi:uncharacterized membrane protein SpoIIM required for sporulation